MADSLKPIICCGLEMRFWPVVENDISRALKLDGGRMTTDDIKDFIEKKEMQLWCVHDGEILATMVTQIIDYPQLRALRVITLTGANMDDWLDVVLTTLSEYGGENGAHILEMTGREGWTKRLKKEGWETKQMVMTRSI